MGDHARNRPPSDHPDPTQSGRPDPTQSGPLPAGLELLQARHVDALTDSVRALNATCTRLIDANQQQTRQIVMLTQRVGELVDTLKGSTTSQEGT